MSEREATGSRLELRGLRKSYGAVTAVDDFSLAVAPGSFTTLLGPSGCGKTTVLRIVAGFVEPDAGSVLIASKDQAGLPPNLRGVGMVFQDYALFPHMSVRANVEYGLRMRKVPRAVRAERVASALELLDLVAAADRYPHELSGGQQQRVALGRVVALEPDVLLMDEPLSNLDAKLRLRLRSELKSLQRSLGITTLYVTHDQEEALSLSDRVVVMDHGRVQQVGTPQDVYQRPANAFVADFVGQANRLPLAVIEVTKERLMATALGQQLEVRLPDQRRPQPSTNGFALVRPEHVRLLGPAPATPPGADAPTTAKSVWQADAVVESEGYFGAFTRYWLRLEGLADPWLVDVPGDTAGLYPAGTLLRLELLPGTACWAW